MNCPKVPRVSKGQALVNFLQLQAGETAQAILTLTKGPDQIFSYGD